MADMSRHPAHRPAGRPEAWALKQRAAPVLYGMYALVLGLVLVRMSERIVFYDTGDFIRAVSFMLTQPGAPSQHWPFRIDGFQALQNWDVSSVVFGLFGALQRLWGAAAYDMQWHALAAKALLLVLVLALTHRMASVLRLSWWGRALLLTLWCLALFQAHNVGMFRSFYGEYLTFLGLIVLLLGLLLPAGRWRIGVVVLGSLVAGLSKVQYFYIPTVVMLCVAWHMVKKPETGKLAPLLVGLALVQLLCLVPLRHNPYQQLNYHQSTYFGSYLLLSQQELQSLGLTAEQQACVGIDGWGHRAAGPGGSQPYFVGGSCYGKQKITLGDVLKPYLRDPLLLFKLAAYALPHHFTTQYFHVYPHLLYILPADGKSFGSGQALVTLSQWRQQWITPLWMLLVCAGAVLGLARSRTASWLGPAMLFMALLIPSQMAISLLGEGIRDLGKHLWGAQLALDILCVLLLVQAVHWLKQRKFSAATFTDKSKPQTA